MKELIYLENRGEFMTIDEAIAKHKAIQQSSELHKDKRGVFYNAQEHEQLVKWLEELKYYKNDYGDIVSKIAIFEADKLKIYNCGYMLGYNKAIDDLISKCENSKFSESDEISLSDINTGVNSGLSMAIHFSEQLKAGITND